MDTEALILAVDQILFAYACNDGGDGSINWDDLDDAFVLAKLARPGRYEEFVTQIQAERDNDNPVEK